MRTWPVMPREKVQAAPTARPKVPMRRRGADRLVMGLERRGWVTAVEVGSTGDGRNPTFNGLIGTIVLLTTPMTYIPVARALGFF